MFLFLVWSRYRHATERHAIPFATEYVLDCFFPPLILLTFVVRDRTHNESS